MRRRRLYDRNRQRAAGKVSARFPAHVLTHGHGLPFFIALDFSILRSPLQNNGSFVLTGSVKPDMCDSVVRRRTIGPNWRRLPSLIVGIMQSLVV